MSFDAPLGFGPQFLQVPSCAGCAGGRELPAHLFCYAVQLPLKAFVQLFLPFPADHYAGHCRVSL